MTTRTGVTMAWAAHAACQGMPTDLFYGPGTTGGARRGRPPANTGKERVPPPQALVEVCERCPVRQECLTHALEHWERGWWGGTTEADRGRMTAGQQRRRRLEDGMVRFEFPETAEERNARERRRRQDNGWSY